MIKVLVVDDEIDICLLLTKQLQSLGCDATHALTIKEGLVKARNDSYNLFFIDLNLTDGSGYDLIDSLHELNIVSKIIVISAYDSEEKKAIQKGANLFVAKPFTKKIISAALQKLDISIQTTN
jgi:CheY-like chemotaxis protein